MARTADTSAVLVAAGSASRMGRNKQLLKISGVEVLVRALSAFERCEDIAELIVVAKAGDMEQIGSLAQRYGLHKLRAIVPGGADRRQSVECGLREVSGSSSYIAIHDGARPFILPSLISRCIADARKYGASALAVPVKDTIKTVEDGFITATPKRELLWQCQTPQVFSLPLYRRACEQADASPVTDDCMLVEALGRRVHITQGDYRNLKITTPEDLAIAQAIAREMEFTMEEIL